MKKFRILSILLCGVLVTACQKEKPEDNQGNQDALNKKDVSYAVGYNLGEVLNKTDAELSMEDLNHGLRDAFNQSKSPRMSEEEIKNTLLLYNLEINKAMQKKQEALRQKNVDKGEKFISEYKKQPDVNEDESGFYYKVIEKGEGKTPKESDEVLVEYTGKKIDGDVFFSTASNGQPAQFTIARVIKGWQLALQKMPEGSTWEIVLPPELAYGEQGVQDVIGPQETLVFEITLKNIQKEEPEEKSVSEEAKED